MTQPKDPVAVAIETFLNLAKNAADEPRMSYDDIWDADEEFYIAAHRLAINHAEALRTIGSKTHGGEILPLPAAPGQEG